MTDSCPCSEINGEAITVDSLFDGGMVCRQPMQGYRFSIDSILLAHFSPIRREETVLDIGCGCGIVGLIMLFRWRHYINKIVGLEIQPELADLARMNGKLNGFGSQYTVVPGDLRNIKEYFPAESFSRVVCNPPFYPSSSGRKNIDAMARIARHQVCATTSQISDAAALVVRNKGLVSIVFPAERLTELIVSLTDAHLQPKRIRMVYSYPDQSTSARLVLVESVKNGGAGLEVMPPFFIYRSKNGQYSEEMMKLYRPDDDF